MRGKSRDSPSPKPWRSRQAISAPDTIGRPIDLVRAQAKIGEVNKSVAYILTKRNRITESPASSQTTPASESSINTQGSSRGEVESTRKVLIEATDKEIEDLSIYEII